MEDKALRLDIIDELDFEPSIHAQDIGVAASNGVVTLTGHVYSYAEKLAVERTVGRIKGVKALAMEIEVRLPSSPKTSDDEVAKRCVDILKWNVWTSESIQARVEHGWVTLTGSVDWAYQRQAAERAIHALSGVRGVSNLIAIKPAVQSDDVQSTIEKAFLRNAELESGHIRVQAMAGQVVLEGNVKTWHERQIAEQAAWSAPGVTSVDDRIRVS
jgi:osmotically-inducible protein OsmY